VSGMGFPEKKVNRKEIGPDAQNANQYQHFT
jgi:hypothetical protein